MNPAPVFSQSPRIILGSRSPQRLELLTLIVPAEAIEVVPPRSAAEEGFGDLHDWTAIEDRLLAIARAKCDDVVDQLTTGSAPTTGASPVLDASPPMVITADTVIVARGADGRLHVLGQPPADPGWGAVVRHWFRDYYAGRSHWAATGLCVALPLPDADGGTRTICQVVKTEVVFRDDVEQFLDWYVATEEPRGKAGGYAIQGAAGVFVSRVEGSISNVIGLPLAELMEMLNRWRFS